MREERAIGRTRWIRAALLVAILGASSMVPAAATARPAGTHQSANYSQVILADHPSMYWRLGELKGKRAVDSSGHGHDAGYQHDPKLGSLGAIVNDPDTSVSFDGVDDDVKWDTQSEYRGPFTVEGWVRSDDRTGEHTFFSTRRRIDSQTRAFDIKLSTSSGSEGRGVRVDVGDGSKWLVTHTILFDWKRRVVYHIVGVASRSGITVYVDGSSIGSLGYSGTPLLYDSVHPVWIGQSDTESPEWFAGRLDEIAVYLHALTASQVAAHYAAGIGP